MLVLGLVDIPWWGMVLILITIYIIYTCRDFNYFTKQGIPGPRPFPFVGTLHHLLRKPVAVVELELMKTYAGHKCIGEFLGGTPAFTVYDVEMLSEIMVREFSSFTNRMVLTSGIPIQDNMLVTLENQHWRHVRNEMTPTFTTGKLKKMTDEMNRCALSLVEALGKQAKTGAGIEVNEYAGGYSMDVIASTSFGIRINSQEDRNNPFVEHARKVFTRKATPILLFFMFFPETAQFLVKLGLKCYLFPKDTIEFFQEVTQQSLDIRKADMDQSRSDFLQLMIRAQRGENIDEDDGDKEDRQSETKGLTRDEILANALIFFLAGYDTTSAALSYFMYNMALYPDVQQTLVDEIERVVGDRELVDTALLHEMPYLDQCINENLRIYPPVLRMNRVANRDITVKGVFIRKGVVVNLPFYGIHHDPAIWPQPDKFDPERFSAENRKNRNPLHFIPFGYGPRNCIGMRLALQALKIAVVHILKRLKVTTCEKTQIPLVFANVPGFLKTEGGIHIKVEPRT